MEYCITIRALIDIKRKDKAVAHAERLFPDLPIELTGRYWKDPSLWEFTAKHLVGYTDDKTALWETLRYFSGAASNWTIITGPTEPVFDTLLSAIADNTDGTGLTWCSIELIRQTTET